MRNIYIYIEREYSIKKITEVLQRVRLLFILVLRESYPGFLINGLPMILKSLDGK